MDCSKAIELLPEYVLGTLSSQELDALEVHLNHGCETCQREIDELTTASTALAEGLEPIAPRTALRAELLHRIESTPQAAQNQVTLPPARVGPAEERKTRWTDYVPLAAATLCAIAAGSLLANFTNLNDSPNQRAAVDPQMMEQWEQSIEAAQQAFGLPRAELIGFDGSVSDEAFQAAIFYDGIAKQLHIIASKVSPPPAGQQPYLWLLDKQGKVLTSSPLEYVSRQRAAGVLDLNELPKNISAALITHEPVGNPAEPQGPVVGRASLKQTT